MTSIVENNNKKLFSALEPKIEEKIFCLICFKLNSRKL